MGIFTRLNTVIKSNLNNLLDKAEDPEKMIGQTVMDMESEVKKAKRELVATLGTAKRLQKKEKEHQEEAEAWEEKAVLALRQGDEDLAREALRRKARALKEADAARRQAMAQEAAADEMKSTLERVEQKIDDLKSRKGTLAAEVRRSREAPSTSPAGAGRFGSRAFDDLERMADGIDQMEAEVEAAKLLEDPDRADVDARFRALEKSAGRGAVDDELAELKKKLGG